MRIVPIALVAGALALAACQDTVVEPAAESAAPDALLKRSGPAGLTAAVTGDRHLVGFTGAIPKDLEQTVAALGGTVDAVYEDYGVAIVGNVAAGDAREIGRLQGVSFVELEPMLEIDRPLRVETAALDGSAAQSTENPAGAILFARQWDMLAIGAPQAWSEGRLGSPDVTLAILDTGLDLGSPDLAGLIDLGRSVSFVPSDDALVEANFPGRHPITDLHWHGSNVASTAASTAFGFAGVTSKTTLMGIKVCDWEGSCPGSGVLAGIAYAIENGADVANMSLGGSFSKREIAREFPGFLSVINRLFNEAQRAGVTFVVSAGNSEADLDHDEDGFKTYCNAPHVICVSATGPVSATSVTGPWEDIDAPSFFTNFGRSAISVAAPGGNDGGAVWSICSTTSLAIPICQTGLFIVGALGTSQAAPHVSGLAALLVEDLGRNPGLIKATIQKGAEDLGQSGTDPFYGKGRIYLPATLGLD